MKPAILALVGACIFGQATTARPLVNNRPRAVLASSWENKGCVTDGTARLLSTRVYVGSANTPDTCVDTCAANGYRYAGLEYSTECWCGNSLNNGQGSSSSACTMRCTGDSKKICGGPYALNLYANPTPPTPVSLNRLGCYRDSSTRLMSRLVSLTPVTPEGCVNKCKTSGFKYAGLEYGNECWCGTTLKGSPIADSSCFTKCQGDTSLTCGGPWALEIYQADGSASGVTPTATTTTLSTTTTAAATTTVTTTTATATTATTTSPAVTAAPAGSTNLGCYVDSGTRLLPSQVPADRLTPESCVATCKARNHMYAGVENGNQCWCGSTMISSTRSTSCTVPCVGDSRRTCGGAWAIQVYEISGTTTTPPADPPPVASNPGAPSAEPVSANAQAAAVIGSVSPASSSGNKQLFAHFMVGNTYGYSQGSWQSEISKAKSAGFDGFALNMGRDSWEPASVANAYAAAAAVGGFKLFLSLDMTSLACGSVGDAEYLVNFVAQYYGHSSQAQHQGKLILSTFSGENCGFGQGSTANGWTYFRTRLTQCGVNSYFVPALFTNPGSVSSSSWVDGQFNWDSGWPLTGQDLNTSGDDYYINSLGGKGYMAAVSPFFFTYYGAQSWNKNWIYRSDNWLMATRFEQLIAMRHRFDLLQLISWNDFGESHYVGEIAPPSNQPMSTGWTNGMPHTGLLSLIQYYATAWKTGAYPAASDKLWLWSRPHPRGANPSSPSNPRPNHWEWTDDNLYVVVTLASPSRVTIESGGNTATWNLPSGLSKLRVASAPGAIKARITRNGGTVKQYDSSGKFSYTNTPNDYNYNYFVAEA